jgi:long-chain acyl-CoA synthetase
MYPDDDLGQRVHALVRAVLPGPRCPRTVELVPELPRGENGKLYKRLLS